MWALVVYLFCFVVQKGKNKEKGIWEGEHMCHLHDLKFVVGINNSAACF